MASDHAGFALKEQLTAELESGGHIVTDYGTDDQAACDLVDFAYPAALAVGKEVVDRAILIGGVGYGSAMIANRILGVDAVVCQDPFCATLARSHSNSNVLYLRPLDEI